MSFINIATHQKHTIDVKPGRLISWDNSAYLHELEPAPLTYPRRMIGPMAFERGDFQTAGYIEIAECTDVAGYKCLVAPLAAPVENYEAQADPAYACGAKCWDTDGDFLISQYNPAGQGTCHCYDPADACPGNAWALTTGWKTYALGLGGTFVRI